jgi:hypothetical protein
MFEYNDEVKKAKKSLNVDEIDLVQKVFKAVFIMLDKHDFSRKVKDVDPKLLKEQLTNCKIVESFKKFNYLKISKPI